MNFHSVGTPLLWGGFTVLVLGLLALDLGVFHRASKELSVREALRNTAAWVALALAFNVFVYLEFGSEKALEFLTGYIIEEALSVDNLFVFLVIFSYFSVPKALQHGVLFWGILGALLMRGLFVGLGAVAIHSFHWVMYLFGIFLVVTGIRLLFQHEAEVEPEKNPVLRLFRRVVPSIDEYRGSKFFVVENGRRYATPLLMVLIALEATDIMFAVDSIPAIFSVTQDPFIVYTSNIFAILGLRSLYFVLAKAMDSFRYLNLGLGVVLAFVGAKMLIEDFYEVPIGLSLGFVALCLGAAIGASLLRRERAAPPLPHPSEGDRVGDRRYDADGDGIPEDTPPPRAD